MIAEIFLVLAGHSSSLFPTDCKLNASFAPLLHPGEVQCLEALGLIAFRYRKIKASCSSLSRSPSRFVSALCATLAHILKEEYESLVVDTEAKVLKRDPELVATGSFVPLSLLRAIFSDWDAPLAALSSLMEELESTAHWTPGRLIDMLLSRSQTGVLRVANILSRLSITVQHVWRTHLAAFVVHGSLSKADPLASDDLTLLDGSMPSCITTESRESIAYIGRAIRTVKTQKWQKQLPPDMVLAHTALLESVLPEDQHAFDLAISAIRTNVGEWLWQNVLTRNDVEVAVNTLADYFLLQNGEFSLSLIREIERLKLSRLSARSGPLTIIREQDLNLAILRASLGTTAQQDQSLSCLRFSLPSGPLRPLLPSLAPTPLAQAASGEAATSNSFASHLLGSPLLLSYKLSWPLDLFLYPADLSIYSALFSYLSALRKTHVRVHGCWTSISNAQRARRRWTGLGEGGTVEDQEMRSKLLRCGWGIVRDMEWFLNTLLSYVMMDVIDVEFGKLKESLVKSVDRQDGGSRGQAGADDGAAPPPPIDFSTLRTIHTTYLDRILTESLLANAGLTSCVQQILDVCERFVGQVERWGGDILPALLSEGTLNEREEEVGALVKERWKVVADINQGLLDLLEGFYEQLSQSFSQQPFSATADVTQSVVMNTSMVNHSAANLSKGVRSADGGIGEVRRHVERLLLKLEFNGGLFRHRKRGVLLGEDLKLVG